MQMMGPVGQRIRFIIPSTSLPVGGTAFRMIFTPQTNLGIALFR